MSSATSPTASPTTSGGGSSAPVPSAAEVVSVASVAEVVSSGSETGGVRAPRRFRSDATADRVMRRALKVGELDQAAGAGAHRAFRTSVLVSAVRCLITYLVIPVLFPLLSLSGWLAAPIGIVLCVIAVVNGVISVRRFWVADHPRRWMYTGFMGVVFAILVVAMVSELHRMGVM